MIHTSIYSRSKSSSKSTLAIPPLAQSSALTHYRHPQWGFGPGITDPRKTTSRKHRFPVLHIVRPKSEAAKFRHPVDVSSMFFTVSRPVSNFVCDGSMKKAS